MIIVSTRYLHVNFVNITSLAWFPSSWKVHPSMGCYNSESHEWGSFYFWPHLYTCEILHVIFLFINRSTEWSNIIIRKGHNQSRHQIGVWDPLFVGVSVKVFIEICNKFGPCNIPHSWIFIPFPMFRIHIENNIMKFGHLVGNAMQREITLHLNDPTRWVRANKFLTSNWGGRGSQWKELDWKIIEWGESTPSKWDV